MQKTLSIILFIGIFYGCFQKKAMQTSLTNINPKPTTTALRFLPEIVSTDSLDFNSAFSQDGNTYYFGKSIKNFGWKMFEIRFDGNSWAKPVVARFYDSSYPAADPFVANDGSIFYITTKPTNPKDSLSDYNIWVTHPKLNGLWTEPESLIQVNSDSTEYYVSVAANGNLYFSSNRSTENRGLDIFVSKYINGKYEIPINLGSAINTASDEHDPCITEDEKFLIFTSDRKGGFGQADLYLSVKNKNGIWQNAKNMGATFNTKTYEYCPNFSPDKNYFFFSSENDVKWISSNAVWDLAK